MVTLLVGSICLVKFKRWKHLSLTIVPFVVEVASGLKLTSRFMLLSVVDLSARCFICLN